MLTTILSMLDVPHLVASVILLALAYLGKKAREALLRNAKLAALSVAEQKLEAAIAAGVQAAGEVPGKPSKKTLDAALAATEASLRLSWPTIEASLGAELSVILQAHAAVVAPAVATTPGGASVTLPAPVAPTAGFANPVFLLCLTVIGIPLTIILAVWAWARTAETYPEMRQRWRRNWGEGSAGGAVQPLRRRVRSRRAGAVGFAAPRLLAILCCTAMLGLLAVASWQGGHYAAAVLLGLIAAGWLVASALDEKDRDRWPRKPPPGLHIVAVLVGLCLALQARAASVSAAPPANVAAAQPAASPASAPPAQPALAPAASTAPGAGAASLSLSAIDWKTVTFQHGPSLPLIVLDPKNPHPLEVAPGAGYYAGACFGQVASLHAGLLCVSAQAFAQIIAPQGEPEGGVQLAFMGGLLNNAAAFGPVLTPWTANGHGFLQLGRPGTSFAATIDPVTVYHLLGGR